MHKLTKEQWKELKQYRIVKEKDNAIFLASNYAEALRTTEKHTKASIPRVKSSMWVRRYAFVVVALLFMLSKYRLLWTGTLKNIHVIDSFQGENWLPSFYFEKDEWVKVSDKEAKKAFQTILGTFAGDTIQHLAKKTKISRLILWENVWGYVIWMYSMLIPEKDKALADLDFLIQNGVWEGIERRSPFGRFLNRRTLEEAMNDYKRVTCCFFFEIPGCSMCSYCPRMKKNML
ncbi:hypothetical protein DCC39_08110 [Pueribacillus theae]|uniref:Aerobactin siderophore biosynthesis IucA/IucC-like C-terminal domain-containing protein n=1 Tax=Pueribacillus theae TaxID=2171751 RepID=A0A2U1K3E2_9BACI|nr:IucA/IucC family C-terminal-domain containing protein [Pueribacillus theae]PWA12036.1 hypothetical protein DCC39_08110 [Pueribacillus theae]